MGAKLQDLTNLCACSVSRCGLAHARTHRVKRIIKQQQQFYNYMKRTDPISSPCQFKQYTARNSYFNELSPVTLGEMSAHNVYSDTCLL